MRSTISALTGKAIRRAARLRGGGSALPGLIVERVDPNFMRRTLAQLPKGVVVISGTNGKTTTTKMVVALLRSQGLNVFTNPSGSNFTRGVTAALIEQVDQRGQLEADIAVLELDEAHAVHFVRRMAPSYSLLLNVMRDQLDRFGEIDAAARLLHTVAEHTTKGVVLNRDDPRLATTSFTKALAADTITTFGVHDSLRDKLPSDDGLRSPGRNWSAPTYDDNTELAAINQSTIRLAFGGRYYEVPLQLKGIYNQQNAAGAVALVRLILGDRLQAGVMLKALSEVKPAFGRGETITVDGQEIELVLVKNPSGFRLSLESFLPQNTDTMIAINDQFADGRDMSWLWDVDFDSLRAGGVRTVCGVRAYDMALRLQYDLVEIGEVIPVLKPALRHFLNGGSSTKKRIYCSYTAMLELRKLLGAKRATEETSGE